MENLSAILVEFYEKLSSWEHDVVKESDLSLPQMHTIEVIGNNRELRMKELSEKLGVSTGTLTVMIKRLEKMNLVNRKKDQIDGRVFRLNLSNSGEKIYQKHHRLHLHLAEQIIELISEDEEKKLKEILQRINQNL